MLAHLLPPAGREGSSAGGGSSSLSQAVAVPAAPPSQQQQRPIKLGPAVLPGPLLLAVSPQLPPSMKREQWCLADFVVQRQLYAGYASTICKARDRVSGRVVALKLYRMHKLNEVSSHQVAREVRSGLPSWVLHRAAACALLHWRCLRLSAPASPA
jgi:hypothetical protein